MDDQQELSNELIGRVLTDSDFRASLLKDPEGTLKAEGIEVDPAIVEAISGMDAEALDHAIADFTAAVKEGRGPE